MIWQYFMWDLQSFSLGVYICFLIFKFAHWADELYFVYKEDFLKSVNFSFGLYYFFRISWIAKKINKLKSFLSQACKKFLKSSTKFLTGYSMFFLEFTSLLTGLPNFLLFLEKNFSNPFEFFLTFYCFYYFILNILNISSKCLPN